MSILMDAISKYIWQGANMAEKYVEGLEEIVARLDNIKNLTNLEENLGKACALVERAAKEKAPKGDGDLRRSISSRVEDNTGIVFSALEYAPYVEYGTGLFAEGRNGRKNVPWAYRDEKTKELIWTSGQHPQPYMRPALNENIDEIMRILKGGLL